MELYSVDSSRISLKGIAFLTIRAGNEEGQFPFFVADVPTEGKPHQILLGINVLRHVWDWQAVRAVLRYLSGDVLNCEVGAATAQVKTLPDIGRRKLRHGPRAMTLPPRAVRLVRCKVPIPRRLKRALRGQPLFVEPVAEDHIVKIQSMVTTLKGKFVELVVTNSSTSPQILKPGALLATIMTTTPRIQLRPEEDSIRIENVYTVGEQRATYQPYQVVDGIDDTEEESKPESLTRTLRCSDGSPYTLPSGLSLGDHLTEKQSSVVADLLRKHETVFQQHSLDLGCCEKIPHKIHLTSDVPINQPYRRVPPQQLQPLRELIQGLLDAGVIQPSASPWASPIVLVGKPDGSLRLCVDYRAVNARTVGDAFPLPRIDDILASLEGAKYFSSFDLAAGFHQLPMDPDSVPITAFRVPFGLYHYVKMPFGLKNAPATMQRLIELCLGSRNFIDLLIFIDDILSYTKTFEEHIAVLDYIFSRLREFNLKLKPSKCNLFQEKVKFLGHEVSADGLATDPSKIEKVQKWPTPKTASDVKAFIGLASYYRRFIKSFAQIAAPLYELTKIDQPFEWSEAAEHSFSELKRLLTEAPVLAFPDFSREFTLEVDASQDGLGAVLCQQTEDNKLHPIAFASRKLRGPELRYAQGSSFKLELLGLKWAIAEKFRDYLQFQHFTVLTDHNPLTHLGNCKLPATETRWLAGLSSFDFVVRYRAGKTNAAADALSRLPGRPATICPVEYRMLEPPRRRQTVKRNRSHEQLNYKIEIQLSAK